MGGGERSQMASRLARRAGGYRAPLGPVKAWQWLNTPPVARLPEAP
jgi:hypothetical protein